MTAPRQNILMCAPDYYDVNYVINPWMQDNCGRIDTKLARQQWDNLRTLLSAHADIALVPPQPGWPDMVFTANAGIVLGKQVVVSHFLARERQGEEPFFHDWFKKDGFEILPWPEDMSFEGAGDALWDRGQPLLWIGSGFRSAATAPSLLQSVFGRPVAHLQLVDPRFYHLDTCLCPLEGGYLMYFPAAFDDAGLLEIESRIPAEKRIIVPEQDALEFACNTVDINKHVFMNMASVDLQSRLKAAGFTPTVTPLSEFMKAGGAAKCLTLKLVEL